MKCEKWWFMLKLTDKQRAKFSIKTRYLDLTTWLDNWFEVFTSSLECVKNWAYCVHDKDEGIKVHVHLILVFEQPQTLLKWVRKFNTTEIEALDRGGVYYMYDYLIHNTSKARLEGKYLYPECERFCSDSSFFTVDKPIQRRLDISQMLDDVQVLTRRQFVVKYGFNALVNYDKIRIFSNDCLLEESNLENISPKT